MRLSCAIPDANPLERLDESLRYDAEDVNTKSCENADARKAQIGIRDLKKEISNSRENYVEIQRLSGEF